MAALASTRAGEQSASGEQREITRHEPLAMAKTHKAQHWIPKSYLRAWTDPDTPHGQNPFVHIFSKDGTRHRKKAPTNIFTETDLYTIKLPDGSRDLRLEHGLSELETAFAVIRKEFLAKHKQLPTVRRLKLMAFVAALHARTPVLRDHHLKFWTEVKDIGEELEKRMKRAKQQEKARAAVSIPSGGPSMTLDDVRRVVSSPMEHTLVPFISTELPFLMQMRCIVLCTKNDAGFITSDAPVVWFDPFWHRKPPLLRSPSFSDPDLEISCPISPFQMLVICHHQEQAVHKNEITYQDVPDHAVTELNRRTRFLCDKDFVVRRKTIMPRWFEAGAMPPDAWELSEGGASGDVGI